MKKIMFSWLFVLATFLTNLTAGDTAKAVIIFDASGSMWGQIDGVPKITIAKDVLKDVVSKWNPQVELGLTVYGHRTKGDCNDIESIIPVGKVDKKAMISSVMSIQPKGKTPISRSMKKVAEEIKYTEEKATIILISDGKETCDPDPCATAKALKAQGVDFITHVIGFNVDKKTDKELECIATATGGEYFSAKNATALNDAMRVITKKVEKSKTAPKPKVKKLKINLKVTATEREGGKWVNAYHRIYKVVDGEAEDSQLSSLNSRKKEEGTKKLEVGKYLLKSEYNDFKVITPFEIKAGEVTKLNVVMGQTGKVEISATEKEGGKWIKAYHRIYKVVDGEAEDSQFAGVNSYKKELGIKQIPVGKYIVKSKYNDFKVITPFEIKAGEVTKLNVVMGQTGKVEISATEKEGGKWIKAYHRIYKVVDGEAEDSQFAGVNSYKKELGIKQIPVGKYIVKSEYNDFKQTTPFEIKAGEVTKLNVVMGQTGKVEISATEKEGGKWIRAYHRIHKVVDGEMEDSEFTGVTSYKKEAGKRQIPVGKYIVKSEYNNFRKTTPFEIKAGKTTKLNIVFGQFYIESKCSNRSEKVSYEIYASSGQLLIEESKACDKRLKLTLDSGTYSVEAKIASGKKEVSFTLGSGKPNSLTIDLTNLNHEEEIKADSPESIETEATPATSQNTTPSQKEEKIKKVANVLKALGGDINEKDAKDLQQAGAMLEMLGGLMKGADKKDEQPKDIIKEDKEFEEMSKDLDMYTK